MEDEPNRGVCGERRRTSRGARNRGRARDVADQPNVSSAEPPPARGCEECRRANGTRRRSYRDSRQDDGRDARSAPRTVGTRGARDRARRQLPRSNETDQGANLSLRYSDDSAFTAVAAADALFAAACRVVGKSRILAPNSARRLATSWSFAVSEVNVDLFLAYRRRPA